MDRTDGVFDAQTVKLSLRKPAPHLWLVYLGSEVETTIDRYDVLDQNVDRHEMLLVLLVDSQRLFVQAVLGGNLCNVGSIVVLQLVDVTDDLALIGADCSKEEKILQVLVVAEGGWLDNDLLKQLNELNREVGGDECPDGDGNIVWVSGLGNSSGRNLIGRKIDAQQMSGDMRTWSMSCLRYMLSGVRTCAQSSASRRLTRYLACCLNMEFSLVRAMSSSSQKPLAYAMKANAGSRASQNLPTTRGSYS